MLLNKYQIYAILFIIILSSTYLSKEILHMADEETPPKPAEENPSEGAPAEAAPPASSSKKKLLLFAFVPILVFGIIAAILYFSGALKGFFPAHKKTDEVAKVEKPPEKLLYYDLPEIFINLNSGSGRINFLKITLSLEVNDEKKVKHIEEVKPRIIDQLQVYLRQLKIDDLKGSAGLQKLREELLVRINSVLEPEKVNDVLFKEMLLQ
jgi:flagellar FliL protein